MKFSDISTYAKKGEPFLFVIDFECENIEIFLLKDLEKYNIEYEISQNLSIKKEKINLKKSPLDFQNYKEKFDVVIEKIKAGDTYLLNLTQPTPLALDANLEDIYKKATAKYKLKFQDKFVCFSPETFIKIENNTIKTFPMKGTIDAKVPNAKEKILANQKEMAEHIMVVDLLRNDLNCVAKNIRVENFRYVEKIQAGEKELLQVSSKICGDLEESWQGNLGEILEQLLPAGSISGTPKKSTLEIIKGVENYKRGYYTGIFGVFDGKNLDSAVIIRYIERKEKGLVYKSGGGITLESKALDEYNELIQKVYI